MALSLVLKNKTVLPTIFKQVTRCYAGGYWNQDWRPGPYPKTEEERRAAAKKYGMIPADYEPYPDDGTGYGDYPMLEPISAEARDPSALYDNPELKRNFGEPMHPECDLYSEDRWNVNQRFQYSHTWLIGSFVSVIVGSLFMLYLGDYFKLMMCRSLPTQQPYSGKKNYSFETVPLD